MNYKMDKKELYLKQNLQKKIDVDKNELCKRISIKISINFNYKRKNIEQKLLASNLK